MCATRLLQYNEHVFGIVLHPLHSFLQGNVFFFWEEDRLLLTLDIISERLCKKLL